MTIDTDDAIVKFGTQVELTTSPATVADGDFSIASDTSTLTLSDDAPTGMFVLKLTDALSAAPTAGSVVNLYIQPLNVEGTGDQVEPTAEFPHTFLDSFPMRDADAENNIEIGPITMPIGKTSAEQIAFIQNLSGVSLGTTWELHFTPTTIGPK